MVSLTKLLGVPKFDKEHGTQHNNNLKSELAKARKASNNYAKENHRLREEVVIRDAKIRRIEVKPIVVNYELVRAMSDLTNARRRIENISSSRDMYKKKYLHAVELITELEIKLDRGIKL